MAGKTVSEKLLIKGGYKVCLINPPQGYAAALRVECPKAVIIAKEVPAADFIQLFVTSDAELKGTLPALKERLPAKGLLWVTYPKGSSKIRTDINRDTIREYARSVGLQTVSLIAVDEVWSALRLKPL
jgi:hypothetical protein